MASLSNHAPPVPVPRQPQNWLQELAYDLALEYERPEELAGKYGLAQEQFEAVVGSPHVQRAVTSYRRLIDEESVQARLKSKRLASILIEKAAEIALDAQGDPAVRLRAIEGICRYAGLDKPQQDSAAGQAAAPFHVNIQINNG